MRDIFNIALLRRRACGVPAAKLARSAAWLGGRHEIWRQFPAIIRSPTVACIIAAIVAPVGDRSIASTRDCLVPEAGLLAVPVPSRPDAFVTVPGNREVADISLVVLGPLTAGRLCGRNWSEGGRLPRSFCHEILHSVLRLRRATEAPPKQ